MTMQHSLKPYDDIYLKTRLAALGISEATPGFIQTAYRDAGMHKRPILSATKEGDIAIPYFTLAGEILTYDKTDNPGNVMTVDYVATRHRDPSQHSGKRYNFPSTKATGYDQPLYLTPSIWEAYGRSRKMDTLYMVEGQFKALAGWAQGFDMVGIEGYWGWKQGQKKPKLKDELVEIISKCRPDNIVLLLDADARQVKPEYVEEGRDLAKRLWGFYNAVNSFAQVIAEYAPQPWVAQVHETWLDEAKGFDDLLQVERPFKRVPDICQALATEEITDPKNRYFQGMKLGDDVELKAFFRLHSKSIFYEHYKEVIGSEKFIWRRGRYQAVQDDKGNWSVKELMHPDAPKYFRVGLDWFKWVTNMDQFGEPMKYMQPWRDTVIKQDHGKILDQCEKYDAFMNLPAGGPEDYIRSREMPDGTRLYNLYEPPPIQPDPTAPFPRTIYKFIMHIFGTSKLSPESANAKAHKRYKLAWDYLTILYNQPTQKLPIICLVSEKNNTGKSTFINLMKMIWGNNVIKLGNDDFTSDFNAHWAPKLVIGIEETLFEKPKQKEKLKAVTTDNYIGMRGLFKDKVEIGCMVHAIITSNYPTTFMPLTDEDERFIVIEVPQIKEVDPDMMDKMKEEVPGLLAFLQRRWKEGKLSYRRKNRMWFAPKVLRTQEFLNVVARSKPGLQRSIEDYVRTLMFEEGLETIYLTQKDLMLAIDVKGVDRGYLKEIMIKKMHMQEPTKKRRVCRGHIAPNDSTVGLFWEFKAENLMTQEEIEAMRNNDPDKLPF